MVVGLLSLIMLRIYPFLQRLIITAVFMPYKIDVLYQWFSVWCGEVFAGSVKKYDNYFSKDKLSFIIKLDILVSADHFPSQLSGGEQQRVA